MQVSLIYPDGKGGERRVLRNVAGERDLYAALGELERYNREYLASHPNFPRLYDAVAAGRIYYEREPVLSPTVVREDWQTAPINLQRGGADCEDLATHRAAELVVSGEDPGAKAWLSRQRHSWGDLWHVRVLRTTRNVPGVGAIKTSWLEDPSVVAGMRQSGHFEPMVSGAWR